MRSHLRILPVLGVLIGLNILFVFVVLWAYLVLLPVAVGGGLTYLLHGEASVDLLRLPLPWQGCLLLAGAFLGGQLYYGYRRVLAGTRGVGGDEEHAVARVVRQHAMTVGIPEPAVRVVDSEQASCYTVGRFTDATVVVTTGLIERLDAGELEAVLAHEVAHIANRDVTLMTITTLFLEIATRAYNGARVVRLAVTHPDEVPEKTAAVLRFFIPLAVLTYIFVAPLLWLFPRVAGWATRTLSHAREFAADAGGARISGRPLALATALVTLAETTPTPERDLRAARTRALCVLPTDMVTGTSTDSLPQIDRPTDDERRQSDITAWLDGQTSPQTASADTHPAVEDRVQRLADIAAEMELNA